MEKNYGVVRTFHGRYPPKTNRNQNQGDSFGDGRAPPVRLPPVSSERALVGRSSRSPVGRAPSSSSGRASGPPCKKRAPMWRSYWPWSSSSDAREAAGRSLSPNSPSSDGRASAGSLPSGRARRSPSFSSHGERLTPSSSNHVSVRVNCATPVLSRGSFSCVSCHTFPCCCVSKLVSDLGLGSSDSGSSSDSENSSSSNKTSEGSTSSAPTDTNSSKRCRAVDIETCDSSLKESDLVSLRLKLALPDDCLLLPSPGDRASQPPDGYFTSYVAHFEFGLTLPPPPLLVEICCSSGLCLSQLAPNALLSYWGFCDILSKEGLPVNVENFHALFIVRRVPSSSFFCFSCRPKCTFLERGPYSRGLWKKRFLYVRDDNWGVCAPWSSVSSKICLSKEQRKFQKLCYRKGLFDGPLDPRAYIPSTPRHDEAMDIAELEARRKAARAKDKGSVCADERREGVSRASGGTAQVPGCEAASAALPPHPHIGADRHSPVRGSNSRAESGVPSAGFATKRARDQRRRGSGLWISGANRLGEVDSFWNEGDFSLALKRSRPLMSPYDFSRFKSKSTRALMEIVASNCAQTLNVMAYLGSALEGHEEKREKADIEAKKLDAEVKKLAEENARLKEALQKRAR